jgi:hypothetical protein
MKVQLVYCWQHWLKPLLLLLLRAVGRRRSVRHQT